MSLWGCYGHARRDAPAPPPEQAASVMVSIPSARFTMGDRNGEPDEYPERSIQLTGFRIDRTEVTNAAYALCVQARACDPTPYASDSVLGKPSHPVVGVTWYDAQAFCEWVKKRLPTEAQWEFAAKGKDHRKFPWKGGFDPKRANTVLPADGFEKTAPVEMFRGGESPHGVLNMAGNVAEWVADYFDPTHYGSENASKMNPTGPESGQKRVVRGGSYRDTAHLVRVSARRAKRPTDSDNTIGFRCVAD